MAAKVESISAKPTQAIIPLTLEEWDDPKTGLIFFKAMCGKKLISLFVGRADPAGINLPRIKLARPPNPPNLLANGSNYNAYKSSKDDQKDYDDWDIIAWRILYNACTQHHLALITQFEEDQDYVSAWFAILNFFNKGAALGSTDDIQTRFEAIEILPDNQNSVEGNLIQVQNQIALCISQFKACTPPEEISDSVKKARFQNAIKTSTTCFNILRKMTDSNTKTYQQLYNNILEEVRRQAALDKLEGKPSAATNKAIQSSNEVSALSTSSSPTTTAETISIPSNLEDVPPETIKALRSQLNKQISKLSKSQWQKNSNNTGTTNYSNNFNSSTNHNNSNQNSNKRVFDHNSSTNNQPNNRPRFNSNSNSNSKNNSSYNNNRSNLNNNSNNNSNNNFSNNTNNNNSNNSRFNNNRFNNRPNNNSSNNYSNYYRQNSYHHNNHNTDNCHSCGQPGHKRNNPICPNYNPTLDRNHITPNAASQLQLFQQFQQFQKSQANQQPNQQSNQLTNQTAAQQFFANAAAQNATPITNGIRLGFGNQ